MTIPAFDEIIEPNDQTEARREHLDALRELIGNAYPNKFARSKVSGGEDTITALKNFEKVADVEARMAAIKASLGDGERPPAEKKDELNEELKALGNVRVAGRLTTPPRGNFVHLTDGMAKLQIYCKKGAFDVVRNDSQDSLDSQDSWTVWTLVDHGDFVGAEGYLFVTNTGEVSVHVERLQFLAKAMLPMPDKMHGIADAEIRQRQRYYDLIGSSLAVEHEGLTTREVFETRAKVISSLRHFLEDHGYVEVETPMLTAKATGAAAKPFKTHHNALDIDLYARIAPELYLKRLVVGGFEKVYELNRNFRNEGISYKHNPEFTMLEFYCAYMDVDGMMDFCEELIRESVERATNGLVVTYEGEKFDFEPKFKRISMRESIITHFPLDEITGFKSEWLDDNAKLFALGEWAKWRRKQMNLGILMRRKPDGTLEQKFVDVEKDREFIVELEQQGWFAPAQARGMHAGTEDTAFEASLWEIEHEKREISNEEAAGAMVVLFDEIVERNLKQPTFIIDFPKSISPLSKASPDNPQIAERFELFINGMEVANGFSELNDPREQYERFVDQTKQREGGDEEAMILDEDYIRALSYGMPPAAGIGIGIDRLVMLLTNKHSIRDVILFPHMRPERHSATEDTEDAEKE